VSVEHKRPLLAFIIVAVICGMVIGHAVATQALPALWTRPAAIVQGIVFPVASAAEPRVAPSVGAAAPKAVAPERDTHRAGTPVTSHRATDRPHAAVQARGHRAAAAAKRRLGKQAGKRTSTAPGRQVGWGHASLRSAGHRKHPANGHGHGKHHSYGLGWHHPVPGYSPFVRLG